MFPKQNMMSQSELAFFMVLGPRLDGIEIIHHKEVYLRAG